MSINSMQYYDNTFPNSIAMDIKISKEIMLLLGAGGILVGMFSPYPPMNPVNVKQNP